MGIVQLIDDFSNWVYAVTKVNFPKNVHWVNAKHWSEGIPDLRYSPFDIAAVLGLAALLTIGRILVSRFIVANGASFGVKKEKTKKKLAESVWKFAYYFSSFCLGVYIMSLKNFQWLKDYHSIFYDHELWWVEKQPM